MEKTPRVLSSYSLEFTVASLLEQRGWEVRVENNVSGIIVDIWASDKNKNNFIIECKAYRKLVGLRTVRQFASTLKFLQEENPQLKAWLITTSGFTANAQSALQQSGIEGYTLDELFVKFQITREKLSIDDGKWDEEVQNSRSNQIRAFVITPFDDGMQDVFILGIRWATNALEIVAKRADDLEHNGEIIEKIQSAIRDYDIIIADTSGANPNVCYEVGYTHALKNHCVLVCRKGNKLPFDLRGTNHLMYRNILDLRELLKKKLTKTLEQIQIEKSQGSNSSL